MSPSCEGELPTLGGTAAGLLGEVNRSARARSPWVCAFYRQGHVGNSGTNWPPLELEKWEKPGSEKIQKSTKIGVPRAKRLPQRNHLTMHYISSRP